MPSSAANECKGGFCWFGSKQYGFESGSTACASCQAGGFRTSTTADVWIAECFRVHQVNETRNGMTTRAIRGA